jgi:peptidoglycan/LPS O-acetylase OafA/YrhL
VPDKLTKHAGSKDTGGGAFAYRPALDGMRALAVIAVLLFHAGVPGISGGFLGVDAFFVLSGFLITSLLLAEHRSRGRIDLRRFWLRRARRLLPALLTVLLATVIAGRFLLDADALGLLRTDAYAALAYVANWRMIFRGTGYVAATAAPSPLQHTWSLGIEEQFYVLWPLLVAGLTLWLAARRARVLLVVACCAGAGLSAVLCARLYHPDDIGRAYYGTDTRAQALLIGAALAAVVALGDAAAAKHGNRSAAFVTAGTEHESRAAGIAALDGAAAPWGKGRAVGIAAVDGAAAPGREGRAVGIAAVGGVTGPAGEGRAVGMAAAGDAGGPERESPAASVTAVPGVAGSENRGRVARAVLGAAGLVGAAVTAWLWHAASDEDAWLYRGGLTVAALSTALVLAAVVLSPRSPLARLLGVAPLVWLGRISYGVYLWHWPLFTFVTSDATGLSRWPLLTVRLVATLAIAIVSYHLIERPIRHGALGRHLPRRVPAAVTATAFGAAVLVTAISTATPPPLPATAAAPVVISTAVPRASVDSGVPNATVQRAPAPIHRPGRPANAGPEPRVTFLGDSVSWVIGDYLPEHPGMWTSNRAVQGCGIATLPDILQQGTGHTNYPGCTSWRGRWQKGIDADNPDVAVIELNRWELMDRNYHGRYQHVGDPDYDKYLTTQLDDAIRIAGSRGAAVVLLTAAYTHRTERPDGSLYPEDQPARVDAWNSLLGAEAARNPQRVTLLDLNPVVCPDGVFTWKINGLRIRGDGLHYTPAAVQRIIAPWLLPKLAAVATGTYADPEPATSPSGTRGRN